MAGSLGELMAEVVAVGTEARFAMLMLREDPFCWRLPVGSESDAIAFALAAGQAAAERVVAQWGREPKAIAAALGVAVTVSQGGGRAANAILFSEYGDRPPSIVVYERSVSEVNRLIRENGLANLLGLDDVVPVHLAHELYHHLEAKRLTPGTAGYRITTLRLGPLRLYTSLPSLCEIAADRFALHVLGLKVPPKALQFVTIHAHNPDYAWALLEQVRELPR